MNATTKKFAMNSEELYNHLFSSFIRTFNSYPNTFDVYSDDGYAVASIGEYNVNETFETEGLYKIAYTMEKRDYGSVTWKSPVSANREVIENAKRQEVKNSSSKQTVNFSVKYQEDSNKVVVVGTPLRVGDANDYGDYWSEDAIRLMSRKFMANDPKVDLGHLLIEGGRIIESVYLSSKSDGGQDTYQMYGEEIPGGSWWVAVEIEDEKVLNAIEEKKLGGFSVHIVNRQAIEERLLDKATRKNQEGLIIDPNAWEIVFLSMVTAGAVDNSDFITIKYEKNEENLNETGKPNIISKGIDRLFGRNKGETDMSKTTKPEETEIKNEGEETPEEDTSQNDGTPADDTPAEGDDQPVTRGDLKEYGANLAKDIAKELGAVLNPPSRKNSEEEEDDDEDEGFINRRGYSHIIEDDGDISEPEDEHDEETSSVRDFVNPMGNLKSGGNDHLKN